MRPVPATSEGKRKARPPQDNLHAHLCTAIQNMGCLPWEIKSAPTQTFPGMAGKSSGVFKSQKSSEILVQTYSSSKDSSNSLQINKYSAQ